LHLVGIISLVFIKFPVRGPSHVAKARPRVADGEGLLIRKVATNILSKQSWRADKGLWTSLGVGRGSTNSL